MKSHYISLFVILSVLVSACVTFTPTPIPPGSDLPISDNTSQFIPTSTPIIEDIPQTEPNGQPIVMTVLPAVGSSGSDTTIPVTQIINPPPEQESGDFFSGDVTLANQGQTINLHMGDSFLLNLGDDQYTWVVNVDNQDVLRMKMGVMVIKGAQGIYDALAPGSAILTATGDPLCRQSTPACAMPSILFTVYINVR